MSANERLHVGIMGAGAIGGYVGGRLAAKGEAKVTLIGRKPLADAVARHGLTLREFNHEDHVDATMVRIEEDAHLLLPCAVVFCCVKAGATAEAAKALANVLTPATVVVSLQNGLRHHEILREALPGNPVLPAVVSFNVIMHEGAVFHRTTSGPLIIETRPEGEDRPGGRSRTASRRPRSACLDVDGPRARATDGGGFPKRSDREPCRRARGHGPDQSTRRRSRS